MPDTLGQGGYKSPKFNPYLQTYSPTQEILLSVETADPLVGTGHLDQFLNSPSVTANGAQPQGVELGKSEIEGENANFAHFLVDSEELAAYRMLEAEIAARVAGE